ncbi:MAG: DUF420 domain-containing protein [Anaerolineaceae bacterium]|nr:DUF420 domain-containing protein [Anaerolineaceae bacterium]
MNPYLQPPGFLGTGASLLADIALLAYILLIVPGMIAGFVFARRGKHRPHHKRTMIMITAVNWLLIIFLMLFAYNYDVAGNIASQPTNARYLMPTIHGILGLVAQLLATYVIYRMLREDSQVAAAKARGESGQQLSNYWFKSAKPVMRLTIILWLITALLGIFNYLIRYDILPAFNSNRSVTPAVTVEPAATSEALTAVTDEPATTAEPATTDEPAVTVEPATTAEIAPTNTPKPRPTATRAPATTPEPGATPEVTP